MKIIVLELKVCLKRSILVNLGQNKVQYTFEIKKMIIHNIFEIFSYLNLPLKQRFLRIQKEKT